MDRPETLDEIEAAVRQIAQNRGLSNEAAAQLAVIFLLASIDRRLERMEERQTEVVTWCRKLHRGLTLQEAPS